MGRESKRRLADEHPSTRQGSFENILAEMRVMVIMSPATV
jgi:hypothetical protein